MNANVTNHKLGEVNQLPFKRAVHVERDANGNVWLREY